MEVGARTRNRADLSRAYSGEIRARSRRRQRQAKRGGDLNTRYEIEPMGRAEKRMQISPITHAGYLAVIIAVQRERRRGYPPAEKSKQVCPIVAIAFPRHGDPDKDTLINAARLSDLASSD